MSNNRLFFLFIISLNLLINSQQLSAATITADTVIDYFNSGAGTYPTSYGGTYPGVYPVKVPLTYATDGNSTTFVSLPKDSYLALGFSGGFIFDGPGLDIFVSEIGGSNELANIFVSSDFGITFTLLGTATTATASGFDLADIGFTDNVNAVKVVGLDNKGGSPGFDLTYIEGLENSVVIETMPVPELNLMALMLTGVLSMICYRRRNRGRFFS